MVTSAKQCDSKNRLTWFQTFGSQLTIRPISSSGSSPSLLGPCPSATSATRRRRSRRASRPRTGSAWTVNNTHRKLW